MDLISAGVMVLGPVVTKVLKDVWDDWRREPNARRGLVYDTEGQWEEIPNVSGLLSVSDTDFFDLPDEDEPPILITGEFIGDEEFVEYTDLMLDEEKKRVVMMILDDETEDMYFYEFGFNGFAISLWPGSYSFYAFIIDPILDEVMGIGYPNSASFEDPNPVSVKGEGFINKDFLIFDIEDFDSEFDG